MSHETEMRLNGEEIDEEPPCKDALIHNWEYQEYNWVDDETLLWETKCTNCGMRLTEISRRTARDFTSEESP